MTIFAAACASSNSSSTWPDAVIAVAVFALAGFLFWLALKD